MKIMVTGSRHWDAPQAVYDALAASYRDHGPFVLVHGACSTGADFYAHEWVRVGGHLLGVTETKYPASWEAYGSVASTMRDEHMVRDGADLCLAFPLPGGKGTQHTMRLAHEAGIPVRTYNTDGSVQATRWGWRLDQGAEQHG